MVFRTGIKATSTRGQFWAKRKENLCDWFPWQLVTYSAINSYYLLRFALFWLTLIKDIYVPLREPWTVPCRTIQQWLRQFERIFWEHKNLKDPFIFVLWNYVHIKHFPVNFSDGSSRHHSNPVSVGLIRRRLFLSWCALIIFLLFVLVWAVHQVSGGDDCSGTPRPVWSTGHLSDITLLCSGQLGGE